MVHRPADSRLLTNLLRHEKDYTHSIISTIETSQSSLASLQAYASASHPASSHVILKVAASLAGADEALRKYTESIEQWRDKLAILKDLEDEVGNIMRDREILVNRLIKASKSQKPTRDSLIGGPPSPTSSYSKDAGSKLSVAKSELQSCETVLADKEQELEIARISLVREGLHQRCRAMVECGWAWGEMGKEGISALEGMGSSVANGNGSHIRHSSLSKHLYPDHTGSDISSITPSISASQLNYGRGSTSVESEPPPPLPPLKFNLDPPHSVSDHAMPIRSPLSKPIALSPDESSDTSEDEQAVEVVENPRFASTQSTKPTSHVHFPQKSSTRSDLGVRPSYAARQKEREQQVRKRSESSSFFGSIANLFRGPRSSGSVVSEPSSPVERSNSKRWSTRTDRNLARARRGDDDSDREDAGITIDYERLSREAKYLPKPPADGTPRGEKRLLKDHLLYRLGIIRMALYRLRRKGKGRAKPDLYRLDPSRLLSELPSLPRIQIPRLRILRSHCTLRIPIFPELLRPTLRVLSNLSLAHLQYVQDLSRGAIQGNGHRRLGRLRS
ncbi:hypothetical protein SISSUDRAFT_758245 [Sistotremastrum suecicum HHB10207 ss-3]|uniref:Uncharacterized protein n=1 Tax=Sistotremastrum suecicum HHB10207 ss-3 TaxID=1314776 RepID=A0A166DDJ5_9AGAM|nr:hypothetical protein SISSUDRAFT_758245 [Sistotremastrum suecicum HHB10207 ss-3]